MKFDLKCRVYHKTDDIEIFTTGRDYDNVATITNNNEYPIYIHFVDEAEDRFDTIKLESHETTGLLATADVYDMLKAFRKKQYEIITPEDCDYKNYELGIA